MKTSKQWWDEVKNDEVKLIDWLKDQYYGETMAGRRIRDFASKNYNSEHYDTLSLIAGQEVKHAAWVKKLLEARGVDTTLPNKEERYWKETLIDDADFETMCGIAAHAEKMRLERIKAIANDFEVDTDFDDIRATFTSILYEEQFHASAFAAMAGKDAIENTKEAHERGLVALGLVI